MAASTSSGSSFMSSSLGRPPTYTRSYVSPVDSTWTHSSGLSASSAPSTSGSAVRYSSSRTLDIGPPGYQATIVLFPETSDERTIYLGPWELVGSEQRRIFWQCSYQNERLEHYLPSDVSSEIFPHTLHSRHRQYHDPADMERYLTFTEPHRIRYITDEGDCIHDQYITVRYEFTTVEGSTLFQGDLRNKDIVGFYDVDVAWTDVHGRTDSYGKVKGIGAIQRVKLWRDRYTSVHSLTVLANKVDGRYREYEILCFDGELGIRGDRAQQLRLNVQRRRGSAPESPSQQRRFSFGRGPRPRVRSGESDPRSPSNAPNIRYLALQFTTREGYRHFANTWAYAYSADHEFRGTPFPPNHIQLPSPELFPTTGASGSPTETELRGRLDTVTEPSELDGAG